MIKPKLIQNKKSWGFLRQITPCSNETTLGVSTCLLGFKLKGVCRNVRLDPPNHNFRQNIYVT